MRAVVVTTLAIFILLLCGVPMFMHPPTAYTGVAFHSTGALVQPNLIDVAPSSPAYRAGLRSGDIISCLSYRDANWLFDPRAGYVPGAAISLCATRKGVGRNVRFVPETRQPAPPPYGSDAVAAIRLAVYALFLLCAVLLVLGRPGLMTWIFYAYTLAAAPNASGLYNYSAVFGPAVYALFSIVASTTSVMTSGLLLAFTALVPEDRAPNRWREVMFRVAFSLAALLGVVYIAADTSRTAFTVGEQVPLALSILTTALVVITLVWRLATMQRLERARFGWAAFAIAWAVIIYIPLDYPGVMPVSDTATTAFAVLTILTPIVLLYAVLKRHVIDIRFAISRTMVYALITTLVVGIIGAVDWATSAYLHEVKVAMALDALVTIAIAFALNRLHRWLERVVDSALFRQKYAAQEYLDRLGPTLLDARREETVHGELVRAPVRAFDLTMAAVFRETESAFMLCASAGSGVDVPPGFDPDHEVVRFLNTGRALVHLRSINYESTADLAIPIFQGKRLTGFVLYGPHNDGTHLDPDEVDTLKRFCDAAAQAYISITYERFNAMPQAAPA